MSIDYTVTLRCEYCHAEIRYVNEPPSWRCDCWDPTELRKAQRWLKRAKHAKTTDDVPSPPAYGEWTWTGPRLALPDTTPYAPCPSCGFSARPVEQDDAAIAAAQASA